MSNYCKATIILDWEGLPKKLTFWQQYPNPCSKYHLTKDFMNLLNKTNMITHWIASSQLISPTLCTSTLGPQNQTITTVTWNINQTCCKRSNVYHINPDNGNWTEVRVQKFGLTGFKRNVTKISKGFKHKACYSTPLPVSFHASAQIQLCHSIVSGIRISSFPFQGSDLASSSAFKAVWFSFTD
uniref:Uncharacterized protein n=1 Tax=Crocodylus porosus TaxID=8502 RepID=A0A7M4FRE8_CROPO